MWLKDVLVGSDAPISLLETDTHILWSKWLLNGTNTNILHMLQHETLLYEPFTN